MNKSNIGLCVILILVVFLLCYKRRENFTKAVDCNNVLVFRDGDIYEEKKVNIPTGSIFIWMKTFDTIPSGYLPCDGSSVPSDTDLYKTMSVTPDFQGFLLAGRTNSGYFAETGLNDSKGEISVKLTDKTIPKHNHEVLIEGATTVKQTFGVLGNSDSIQCYDKDDDTEVLMTGERNHPPFIHLKDNTENTGSSTHHCNIQKSLVVNYIIKS